MADISTELQAIMDAIYGEDVRSSIHDAIDLINKVSEATLTIGTAVTSASSSVTGFYEDSVYINKTTWDVWKCTGTAWSLQGNIKGATGATGANGVSPAVTISTITGGHSVKITDATHPSGQTFNVMDGSNGAYFDGDALILT